MSFAQIATSVTIINSGLIGYCGVSLTNFTTSAVSAIAEGSAVEIAGAYFKADADLTINASSWTAITTAATAYLALIPSGSAGSQTISAEWTATAPEWSTSKQGYYASAASTTRVIGTARKTGASSQEYKKIFSFTQKGEHERPADVSLGSNNFENATTCYFNVALGVQALQAVTLGHSNVAIGQQALVALTEGHDNVAIGRETIKTNTTGDDNIAIGFQALTDLTTGDGNIGIGAYAGTHETNGTHNVSIGITAGYYCTAGSNNVFIGYAAGVNTKGANNVFIGGDVAANTTAGSNNIAIGYQAEPQASASNSITLGNGSITIIRAQVTTITALSDKRDKADIEDYSEGLSIINAIQPRSFRWDKREWYADGKKNGTKKQKEKQIGFIAQELKDVSDKLNAQELKLVNELDPEKLETTPGNLLPVIVNAIKELDLKITALSKEINILKEGK